MAIDPKRVAYQVALRAQQLEGTDQATLETAYTSGDLEAAMDGAEVPFTALRDAVLASEARLAHAIGSSPIHAYRAEMLGVSEPLASGDEIPPVSDEDLPFVGSLSQIIDATTSMTLNEATIQEVRRFLRGSYAGAIYKYAIESSRIYHTRENVKVEGVVFDRELAENRFLPASTLLSPIPEALEHTWIADTIAHMVSEGWLEPLGSYYAGLTVNGLAGLMLPASVMDSATKTNPIKG